MLTKREKQILQLVLKENTSADIAGKLKISQRTVETHRKNILRKTGAKNIVGLVKYAIHNRMVFR